MEQEHRLSANGYFEVLEWLTTIIYQNISHFPDTQKFHNTKPLTLVENH